MKKLLSILSLMAIFGTTQAQAPQKMTYQSIIRDASNNLLTSTNVGIQISILQGSSSGTSVFTETHSVTTNMNGLATFEIGTGTVVSGDITTIDWSAGPYFVLNEIDPAGGTNYTITGTSELVSVPYALHAATAGNAFSGDYNDLTNAPATIDLDSTNELNTSVVLNGTDLEITDAGGTIITDLSSLAGSGSGYWAINGIDISNTNTGSVGIGINTPQHKFSVADTSAFISMGHTSFNNPNSGGIVFNEDQTYTGGNCGLILRHSGANNMLMLSGECPTTTDTAFQFSRQGDGWLRNVRIGVNFAAGNPNTGTPLIVDGNSDFTGDMTITGNLTVTGNIAKGGGTFKIDHPLDPANKYLVHSFVESPEMINVYSGNITTDANGYATVTMPAYFESANSDFRYQLTVIGAFAQAIIKEKIDGNTFVIQTNQPSIEVSWQVTGVRKDPYANANRVEPEMEKDIKDSYVHPELYGQPKSKGEAAMKRKAAAANNTAQPGADGQR